MLDKPVDAEPTQPYEHFLAPRRPWGCSSSQCTTEGCCKYSQTPAHTTTPTTGCMWAPVSTTALQVQQQILSWTEQGTAMAGMQAYQPIKAAAFGQPGKRHIFLQSLARGLVLGRCCVGCYCRCWLLVSIVWLSLQQQVVLPTKGVCLQLSIPASPWGTVSRCGACTEVA